MAPLDHDPDAMSAWIAQWQEAQRTWSDWWQRSMAQTALAPSTATAEPPAGVAALNARFQRDLAALWRAVVETPPHGRLPDIVEQPPTDRRFAAKAWHEQPFYSLLRQWYLLYASYLRELAALAPLPEQEKRRLQFATKQYVDAIAPTNFPATNPDVLRKALETEGASLVQGLRNLVDDARKGRITMTDEGAFAVGRNLAVTPGSVVYRNELIELIQYEPTTPKVGKRPLVVVPPCINKYYILDLTPGNSFVAHAVAQGHTVFMVSWRNVPAELGSLTWDDYLEQGAITALRVAGEIAGSKSVNALGFCVGGTILACALAVLSARKQPLVASVTLLTTMLDFADPGDIGVYVSEQFLASREAAFMAGERVHGSELASAFASLRPNELVWNYVVGNYMKGESPPAFDLLYWNSDSANLPGPMYVYYLRNMYLDNKLREPKALTMCGVPVDLSRITIPVYVLASREDHIVPWRSAYRTTTLVGGDVTFVLAASGHIAGVVNPPQPPRRNYWTNDLLTDAPEDWFARAQSMHGSWWPHWYEWLAQFAGSSHAKPRDSGNAQYPPIEPAPGTYVRESA
jgi:polyhydroxyalkanoate synthase